MKLTNCNHVHDNARCHARSALVRRGLASDSEARFHDSEHSWRFIQIFCSVLLPLLTPLSMRAQTQATPVSLLYQDELNVPSDIIMTDIIIDSTAKYTYYAALQWDFGYMGIQRAGVGPSGSHYKHVHFSLWGLEGSVVWHAPDVEYDSTYDGGWGYRSVWPFRWEDHATYRLLVKNAAKDSGMVYDAWTYDFNKRFWKHLITCQYPEQKPFRFFAAFIEDFGLTSTQYRACSTFNVRKRLSASKVWVDQIHARYSPNGADPHRNAYTRREKFVMESGGGAVQTATPNSILTVKASLVKFAPLPPQVAWLQTRQGEADTLEVAWAYSNPLWSPQETYRLALASDTAFSSVLYDSGTRTSSDTTARIGDLALSPDQRYYLALDTKSIFDLPSSRMIVAVINYVTAIRTESHASAPTYALEQNHPNPFNPITTIRFMLKQREKVSLKIYNVSGALVRDLVNQELPAGEHEVDWNGRDGRGAMCASGLYFYTMITNGFSKTHKLLLLK